MVIISIITSTVSDDDCEYGLPSGNITEPVDTGAVPSSVDEFVKQHKDAYILAWKAGGFLPSASISQTMVENGFNFTNPSGTSFWQAHNMGGVKTSKKTDFPVTIATFGEDSVDITGTKPGTNVGDNTGGQYTWFKSYSAGIVGKSEFMAHQTLYTGAINNTDGAAALTAIFNGGWATDPSYLMKLQSTYSTLGKKYQWLDQEAIAQHGTSPYNKNDLPSAGAGKIPDKNNSSDELDSNKRGKIIELARSRIGIPYVWGGRNWETGMDCSGLTLLVYKRVGIELPATSETQSNVVKQISKGEAQRGDLVFWGGRGSSHHVAIYAGNNKVIEEPQPGQNCQEIDLYGDHWFGKIEGLGEDSDDSSGDSTCEVVPNADTSDQVVGQNSAPTLEVPAEYKGKLTLPAPDNNNYAGNNYPFGQCTHGAYNRMAQIGKPIEWFSGDGGNGGSWGSSAKARGYTVIKGKPEVGWAASFYGGLAGSTPPYGHIAVVEYVNPDGSILISETNVVNIGSGTRSWRVINKETVSQVDFIQGKGS
ncbi:NlpC/P60 family protein [Enterococcus hulanensis]|uniref:NlpC/P60 family protein n=1 Tax=Enterococcus hulanensis TaxID=2559929 RepID=UPI0010F6690E|nr:NlpC/P60 family protein [Enterococcus hulanensis]